jgi:carboxypeptidase family protein/TonB-dependent receptor-like protein
MQRLHRVLAASAILSIATAAAAPVARAQSAPVLQGQTARLLGGSISGIVSDDRGGPLAGVVVSALGPTTAIAMTVSDARGSFSLNSLPAGEYVVQAHLRGFSGSARERVRVGAGQTLYSIHLRRLDAAVGTTGATAPVAARPIMAAGIDLPSTTLSDQPDGDGGSSVDHPRTETAWRLRHIKRSILKDASPVTGIADDDEPDLPPSGSFLGRAVDTAASAASTLFSDLPITGEVNLLTTGAFAPGDLFSGDTLPRGVAYLSIGAPTPAGDWSVRAAMSEGDLSSWIVAGAFASRPGSSHTYNLGLSYSTQEYMGGNPFALAAVTDGSRNVGELYAFDRWALSSTVSVEYGGRYAHYDYLERRGLLSPRVSLTVEPVADTRIVTSVWQRMLAPGAEEFLAEGTPGPWLPPERTFAPLGDLDSSGFRIERARSVDFGIEHQFDDAYVLGLHRFRQSVDDQLVTIFGLQLADGPKSVGHYYVASAGPVDADGWTFRIASPDSKRVRGSVDYTVARARWTSVESLNPRLGSAGIGRRELEDVHDVTSSFEATIPETATHVFLLYKVNTAFAHANPEQPGAGLDGRFDLQVNQALPFGVAGTKWEVLVGMRNLFRDPSEPGSIYDELLVVRPPKRVVGGVLVRF